MIGWLVLDWFHVQQSLGGGPISLDAFGYTALWGRSFLDGWMHIHGLFIYPDDDTSVFPENQHEEQGFRKGIHMREFAA